MKKILMTAASAIVALSMTVPAFAEPADTDTSTDTAVTATASPEATTAPETTAAPVSNGKYSFPDISGSQYAWAAPYIQDMYDGGYVTGYEDGTYRPDDQVTRQECLTMFARAMGSGDEANEKILEIAHEKYDDTLKLYGLSWGKDEIAFLMYKGILKETDLDTYLKNSEKSTPAMRYEAAIIITKAMGGESEANSGSATLSYSDTKSIPVLSLGYVKYVTDNGIMNGMENNNFSPKTFVTRAQMAVMLSRVTKKCNYSTNQVKLMSINTSDKTVNVKDSDGKSSSYVYTDDTVMRTSGDEVKPEAMIQGVSAVITLSGSELAAVDALSSVPDETVVGKYQSYGNTNGKLVVWIIPTGESNPVSYECKADVAVMFDESPATIRSFKKGDYVSMSISDGQVESVSGTTKTTTVSSATVEDISISPSLTIKISHADEQYDGVTFDVANDVIVSKNGGASAMDEIFDGDTVTLTLEYGVVTKVVATSKNTTREGVIKSITYTGSRSSMVVNINGTDTEYEIPESCTFLNNGNTATLYDFRVGDTVTMTIESNAVTKMNIKTAMASVGSVTGVVQSVNTSYGFINVLADGSSVAQTVFCKDTTTKFLNAKTGDTIAMKNLNIGDTVQVSGSSTNGAFVAKVVLVTPVN